MRMLPKIEAPVALDLDGSRGLCFKVCLMGHDHVTWPTREAAETEADRLARVTGCALPQVEPIAFA